MINETNILQEEIKAKLYVLNEICKTEKLDTIIDSLININTDTILDCNIPKEDQCKTYVAILIGLAVIDASLNKGTIPV